MLLHIKQVLTPEQAADARARVEGAQWVDGNVTSGHQSAQAKYNEQLPEDSPLAQELGRTILAALERSALFMSAALPKQVFPPLFNRYTGGMSFRQPRRQRDPRARRIAHADAHRPVRDAVPDAARGRTTAASSWSRTPTACTTSKLPAGDLVLYPATSLHRVTPVTRGARVSSFFWIQSMVADDARRSLLFDLDMAIVRLARDTPGHPSLVSLTGCYHNLLRMWAEL